ncbi:hypothetical protein BDV93DRAFT_282564 [Ceratobasidium sp. AG-I]|nr:hypothetical protein BDV93DRAFT_282564 [Ceratobasidium sp. AG-I]
MHLFPIGDHQSNQFKTWRFERIGSDTGEELTEAFREEVERLKHELVGARNDMAQKERMLAEQEGIISQLRQQQDELKHDNAKLQGRMEGIEYAMAQMIKRSEERFANLP